MRKRGGEKRREGEGEEWEERGERMEEKGGGGRRKCEGEDNVEFSYTLQFNFFTA